MPFLITYQTWDLLTCSYTEEIVEVECLTDFQLATLDAATCEATLEDATPAFDCCGGTYEDLAGTSDDEVYTVEYTTYDFATCTVIETYCELISDCGASTCVRTTGIPATLFISVTRNDAGWPGLDGTELIYQGVTASHPYLAGSWHWWHAHFVGVGFTVDVDWYAREDSDITLPCTDLRIIPDTTFCPGVPNTPENSYQPIFVSISSTDDPLDYVYDYAGGPCNGEFHIME